MKKVPVKYKCSLMIMFLELMIIIVLFLYLAQKCPFFLGAAFLNSFIAFLSIVNRDTNPENKVTWVSIVLFFPPFGALLYVMFFERRISKKEIRHMNILNQSAIPGKESRKNLKTLYELDGQAYGQAVSILRDDLYSKLYVDTNSEYYTLGERMHYRMLVDLKKAKQFIFLEYFIIDEGKMWNDIFSILKEKAAAGIEVRVLYDDFGCMTGISSKYIKILQKNGIKCGIFNRIFPVASPIHNNRDHRKIMVIDGKVGYTGGINLADEYINQIEKYGHWKDGGVRLEGLAVEGLTRMFLMNWDLTKRQVSSYKEYESMAEKKAGGGFYIPFGSGPKPMYKKQVGKNVLLNIINQAQKYVYIMTPYLIIDYDLTEALQNAGKRGASVKIITPGIPDKKLVQLMTRSNYQALLRAGVQIYEYAPGFIHAKTVLADDKYAVVGTINLDYRSLVHHYEDAVWMYQTKVIPEIQKDMLDTFHKSKQIRETDIRMNWIQIIIRDSIRLFSPML